jgi:endonuclease YncB( thermonuclease family)
VTVALDLGFGHWFRTQMRLAGIDAPEMVGPDKLLAERSRDYLRGRILGKWVVVHCGKQPLEKYGRVLGRVFMAEPAGWTDICQEMVTAGMATAYLTERDPTAQAVELVRV